jgi:hypothetical protein
MSAQASRRVFGALAAAAIVSPLLGVRHASAHHGWGQFVSETPWFMEGRLVAVSWRNPHPTLQLRVAGASAGQPWMSWPLPPAWEALDAAPLLRATTSPAEVVGEWSVGLGSLWRQRELGLAEPPAVGDAIELVAVRHCTPARRELRALLLRHRGRVIQQQSHRLPPGCSGRQTG